LFAGIVVNIVSYALQFGISTLVLTLGAWAAGSGGNAAAVIAVVVGVAAAIATVLALIASLAFISAVQALVYLDLRVRREGLDLWLRPVLRPTRQATGPRR
jgi:fatty acid desaturase